MEEMALVYTTWPDAETAEGAARQALAKRLAACANIMEGTRSMYWWEGVIETQSEAVMLLKTRDSLTSDLRDLLIGVHPYATPCVITVPIRALGSNTAFLTWIEEQTISPRQDD